MGCSWWSLNFTYPEQVSSVWVNIKNKSNSIFKLNVLKLIKTSINVLFGQLNNILYNTGFT